MLSIKPSKKKGQGFFVTAPTTNGRILSHSEILTTKHNAFKNVTASLKLFGGKSVLVADYALEEPKVVKVFADGKKVDTNLKLPKDRINGVKQARAKKLATKRRRRVK